MNDFYNGWLHDNFLGCVFAFVPSGVVVDCMLNAPRNFITKSRGHYEKLKDIYNKRGGIAVIDSMFS